MKRVVWAAILASCASLSLLAQNPCHGFQNQCINSPAFCYTPYGALGKCTEHLSSIKSGRCTCDVPPSPPVKCKDPGGALTLKTEPVLSFPANRTFTPDGNVAISELTNPPVISMPMDGSMTVLFETVPEHPGTIKATIQSLNFSFGSITLLNGDSTGSNTVIRHGDQSISIDRASGATIGKLWTRAGNSLGMFETDSPITGNMDFNSGKWTILTNNANNCVRCDINGDGQVDSTDISIILDSRGASSGPNDSRDVDSDGQITTNDARICSLACTHPNCAK